MSRNSNKRKSARKTRKVWLNLKIRVPRGTSQREVINTLAQSIRNGSYKYPSKWDITIEWRNKEFADMKSDEFTSAMRDSARSSPGFDNLVLSYLESR